MTAQPKRSFASRLRSQLLRLGLVLGVSFVAAEGLVRGILFEGWFSSNEAIAELRRSGNFSHFDEDEHYEIDYALGKHGKLEAIFPDPMLGWLTAGVKTGTYDHQKSKLKDPRRHVLLFGDSYAACNVIPKEDRFDELWYETGLGEDTFLVNYGTGGYGSDQICLLAQKAVPNWIDRDPIVLMSLMVDDDMDRCRVSVRPWVKPRLRLTDDEANGGLELERFPLPTTKEHMDAAFPLSKSWAWRMLLHRNLLPDDLSRRLCGDTAAIERTQEINRRLFTQTIEQLKDSGLTFGFVLFYNWTSVLQPETLEWREQLIIDLLEEHDVPYVNTRPHLAERIAGAKGKQPQGRFYILRGAGQNHLNRRGNKIVLEDIEALVRELMASEG